MLIISSMFHGHFQVIVSRLQGNDVGLTYPALAVCKVQSRVEITVFLADGRGYH